MNQSGPKTLFLIVTLFLAGCPGPAPVERGETVEVTGTITLDDKPLDDSEISFTPVDEGRVVDALIGAVDKKGNFSIAGVSPGEYEVWVNRMIDGEPDPALAKYQSNSPLRANVTKDKTTFDFKLTSGQ